jgi:O-antigen/teichoic acid export membrane protein
LKEPGEVETPNEVDSVPVASRPGVPTELRSLNPAARRGGILTLVGYAASQLLRLIGNLVLWRLLHPEAFGLMAIVNVFLQGLHMFSDVGIGPSIIQNKRGDEPDYLNTAWTIQAVRGFLLFLAASAAAAPVALFYGQPALAALIPVVAFGSVLSGFNSTRLITSTRNIALGRLTVVDLCSQASGLIVMVGVAYVYRTIWALVIGSTVTALVKLILSHTLLTGVRNRLRWDRSSALTLIRFGRWIFLSTLLGFAVEQSDRLIFGKLIPMSLLGVYSIALMWASLPTQVISNIFNSVIFPVLSRVHNADEDMPTAFREYAIPWLIFAGWLSSCLLCGAPVLIRFLYDHRALEAGGFMQILGIGTWFGVLASANATTLFARGVPKWVVLGSAAKLFGMVVLIPLGMAWFGFPGAIGAFAASELLTYAVMVTAAARLKLKDSRIDVQLSLFVALTAAAGFATGKLTEPWMGSLPPRVAAFCEGALMFVVVSAGWGYWFFTRRARGQQRVLLSA